MPVEFCFVGDIFLGGHLVEYAGKPNYEVFSQDIIKIFKSSDITVGNLESPVMKIESIDKNLSPLPDKPLQASPDETFPIMKDSIDIVSLANNHIFDYGEEGLYQTIRILEENNILHVGAGIDLESARRPVIVQRNNLLISFHAYCDYQKPYLKMIIPATADSYGVAPLKLEYIEEDLRTVDSDLKVVFLHWGREDISYPDIQDNIEIGKKLIDMGADIIVATHPHVVQPTMWYKGKVIIFSLGNFLYPNYYYRFPTETCYLNGGDLSKSRVTYDYPKKVDGIILKKWRKENRISMISRITYSNKLHLETIFTLQEESRPFVGLLPKDSSDHIRKRLDEIECKLYSNEYSDLYPRLLRSWHIKDLIKRICLLRYSSRKQILKRLYEKSVELLTRQGLSR
jgi:hypothetical protein